MLMYPRLYLQFGSTKGPNLLLRYCSLIYVNETICWYSALLQDSSQLFYDQGWIIWCHSKFDDVTFFSLTDCEWLYNMRLKTRRGGYSFDPFWCLCQKLSLSPLYFNKALLHKSSEWSSLVSGPRLNSSPPKAKNPASYSSATTCHLGGSSGILEDKVSMLRSLVLCSPSEHIFCCTLLTLQCACVSEWNEGPCSAVRSLHGDLIRLMVKTCWSFYRPANAKRQPMSPLGTDQEWVKRVDWTLLSRSNFLSSLTIS